MQTLTEKQLKDMYGEKAPTLFSQSTPKKQGFLSEALSDIKQTGSNILNTAKNTFSSQKQALGASIDGKQSIGAGLGQAFGIGAGGVSSAIGDTVVGAAKTLLPQGAEDAIKSGIVSAATPVVQSDPFRALMDKYNSLDEKGKRNADALLGIGSLATDFLGAGVAKKGVKPAFEGALDVAKKGVSQLKSEVAGIPRATEKLTTILKEGGKPTLTAEKAAGQIVQGKTKDINKAVEAIKSIDTSKVRNYSDLDTELSNKIPKLVEVVDSNLAQDARKYSLDELSTLGKTKSGAGVSQNYVKQSLDQLEELYEKTGDAVSRANIQELKTLAEAQGLSRLEVNDIARTYGQEFGSKAFSVTGEPLTSVNSQMYENVRKGVKEVARAGINSKEAIKADRLMSSIYNTRSLVQKNIEAVNKLKNRIEERGLLEKIGNSVSKYTDVLTGGGLRGLVGGLLPRGAGYKTLNALDLEELLQRNLKVIQEAGKAKTVKQFNETMSKVLEPKISTKQGKIAVGGAVNEESIMKDLMSYDPLPMKSSRGLEFGDTDLNFRLGELQDLAEKRALRPSEISEARDILKKVGALSKASQKKGSSAVNPLTGGAAVGGAAALVANNRKK